MEIVTALIPVAMLATVVVLFVGIGSMARGGVYDQEHAVKFMWERVILQSVVVLLLVATAILASA